MKRKCFERILSAVFIAILAFANYACDNKEEILPRDKEKQENKNPHAISQEQALASLQAFLASFDDETTRSVMTRRKIKDVFSVEFHKDVTRGDQSDTVDCDNLLYVANFEDGQGYAILAADDRVQDEVLAVVEKGSMPPATMKAVAQNFSKNLGSRPVFSGFPTTGLGYVSSAEYPDEVFMNPNTVDLADSIEGDTLVGDFDPCGSSVIEPESPSITGKPLDGPYIDLNGELVGGYVYEKARNDLYDESKDNSRNPSNPSSKNEEGGYMEISYGDWREVFCAKPLLGDFCTWHQQAPFNLAYPSCSQFWGNGVRNHAFVGCVPLALAKVIVYKECPQTYSGIDIKSIREGSRSGNWAEGTDLLLYKISQDCHSKYFYNGTFTFPFRAKRFLKNHGYSNVHKKDYSFDRVSSMIKKDHPVIMFAMPRFHITKSHCWNIDGYKIMKKDITYHYYSKDNVLVRTDNYVDVHNMVHCDFGWGGSHNGYFTSGVFKLNDSNAEYDDVTKNSSKTTHYNNFKRILTYDCSK